MKKLGILAVVAAVALAASTAAALNQNSGFLWVKGILYTGSSRVALTDATGTLAFSAATSRTTSITAFATGGQGSATAITSDMNIVTTCATAADSVVLPADGTGRIMSVTNSGAAALAVFPASGDTINGLSANASLTVPVGGTTVFRGISSSAWKSDDGSVNGQYFPSLAAATAAAGTSKTDATALTKEYTTITGTALQGVSLLTAAIGLHQFVYNDSAVSLIVYPLDAGNDTLAVDNFAALTADVGWVVGPLGSLDCTAYTTTAWFCKSTFGARASVAATGSSQATGTALTSVNLNSEVEVTAADGSKKTVQFKQAIIAAAEASWAAIKLNEGLTKEECR